MSSLEEEEEEGRCRLFELVQALLSWSPAFFLQGSPDLVAAREVADYLGTQHQEFYFTVQVRTYVGS